MKRKDVMKNYISTVLIIVCSFSLTVLVLDSICENDAFGAENEVFKFPEAFLSQTVEWEECEFFNARKMWRNPECADIRVPLYWEDPEGQTMTIHVKRLRALVEASKQIWFLDGGPGYAGTAGILNFYKTRSLWDWTMDLYTLDHRGTGYSERLGCPEQEADDSEEGITISDNEWGACIDYLEANYNLDAFTATQAAKDVGFVVELLKEEKKEVFVQGASYGTYLGHRYAQIFPDQANGLIFDSVLPSVNSGFDQMDILINDVAEDFFNICKEDDFCSSKMGNDPWAKANDIFDRFKNGYCAEASDNGLTPELLQFITFGGLDYRNLRIVLPALYYRIDRCSEKDVSAFKHLVDNVYPQFTVNPPARQFSEALLNHIGLSELMSDNPISPEDMKEIDKTLLATGHFSYKKLELLEKWPTYGTDENCREWASQDVPILMLNSSLDQRTPIDEARIAQENLTGPNQYFIEIPNANHGAMFSSPVKNIFAPDCGIQIVLNFIEDPLEEPDTSCLDDLVPIDFRGNPLLALVLFGTWNLWENGINTNLSGDQILLMKEEANNILHDLRQQRPRLR